MEERQRTEERRGIIVVSGERGERERRGEGEERGEALERAGERERTRVKPSKLE